MARAPGGHIKRKKGEAGAAKNYITRTQAIKKLQCSMSDFRRLCILKGIFPRQPRNHKKANKGSTAPASFYYVKDIQYLLHEPVLQKLREHKAFAKKLSKAIGRGEWSTAKSLEENKKPKYRLDHIIKERYPSFPDALRDLDDALSLIVLFANLPANDKIPASIIANCGKLAAEWQLYVMRTRSLRKVFLSIKGIYFQAVVKGETVTWLIPYMFTQNIPSTIDFRIMMTFLELYQTLLGFTFYKLYSDINLVYPPKLDEKSDEGAGGIGSLLLEETSKTLTIEGKKATEEGLESGKKVTAKDVKKQIRSLTHGGSVVNGAVASTSNAGSSLALLEEDGATATTAVVTNDDADVGASEFPKPLEGGDDAAMQTEDVRTDLFEEYYFYLSREVTRPTLEFIIRSFGGAVGWDDILGVGSPYKADDPRITHHVIDRPVVPAVGNSNGSSKALTPANGSNKLPGKRAYVQPQWVVDCINQKTLLPTDAYAPGKVLPPHLSPFVDVKTVREQGGYVPTEADPEAAEAQITAVDDGEESDSSTAEDEDEEVVEEEEEFTGFGGGNDGEMEEDDEAQEAAGQQDDDEEVVEDEEQTASAKKDDFAASPAMLAAAANPEDASLLHAAELEAEARSIPYSQFQSILANLQKEQARKNKKLSKSSATESIGGAAATQEANPASMLLSNKQRKLFNKMKYGENKRREEAQKLADKKRNLVKAEKRASKRA